MRFSESKIKAAILDSDLEIRQRAISFFADSFSSDTSVMPLVIQTIETFGRQDAYHLIGQSRDLPQTDETIAWILDELNDEPSGQNEDYAYNLSMVLVQADAALLLPQESAILESRHFLPELREIVSERLQMLAWDEATCWQKLETFCDENKDEQYVNEINVGYANRIVEALARCGEECEERVHAVLREEADVSRHSPTVWMELAVRLAGEMRLDSTVPRIVTKLAEDGGDLLNEECARALTRIGTATVLEAVSDVYSESPHHFRLYATRPLECLHSDLAVAKCLHLLRQEKDTGIQVNLAQALLSQFAQEGIEESRKLLIDRELDFESRGLRNFLVETCTISGERFPEYDEWRIAGKTERDEHRKQVEELGDDPAELIRFALEKLTGKTSATGLKPESAVARQPHRAQPQTTKSKQRVGRNDLCPCGSGKKYKKCCLNKSGDNPLLN